jgi:hypothetical protein
VLEVRKEAVFAAGHAAGKAAGVFGAAEIDAGVLLPITASPTAGRAAGQHV